jgi:transcriptional regulator with XRE-family HTH domain
MDRYNCATHRQLDSLARIVRETRVQLGFSETQAASLSGVSVPTLRAVEAGDPQEAAGSYVTVLVTLGLTPEPVHTNVGLVEDRY